MSTKIYGMVILIPISIIISIGSGTILNLILMSIGIHKSKEDNRIIGTWRRWWWISTILRFTIVTIGVGPWN